MKNRTNKILELLTQKNKIEVSQLSENLVFPRLLSERT